MVEASINKPGGYVTLRAEQGLLLVVTTCSVDHHPTNGDAGDQTEPDGKDIAASFCAKLAASCALISAARIRLSKWLVSVRTG